LRIFHLDDKLLPDIYEELKWEEKIQEAKENLHKATDKRNRQAAKHQTARRYDPEERVWVRVHKKSNAKQAKPSEKISPSVYEGPYQILKEIRRNVYLVGDLEGQPIGAFNTRQIRPHRKAKYEKENENSEEKTEPNENEYQ